VVVAVLAPVLDEHLGFDEAGEQLDGEELVADREPKPSTEGFCREPGSMYALPAWLKRHQWRTAWTVISGSSSHRTNAGTVPLGADPIEHLTR
jgi:hypothetical protein